MALFAVTSVPCMAQSEDDYDESIRMPIRRLHPEREREKARQKLQQELDAKNKKQQADDDAWSDDNQSPGKKRDNRRVVGKSQLPQSSADRSLIDELLNKDYSLVEYLPPEPKRPVWQDDPIVESESELLSQVSKSSPQTGTTRYMPRDVTMASTENAFYAYFTTSGSRVDPLRLRVQYYADDPLQFNDILFEINGFDYRRQGHRPHDLGRERPGGAARRQGSALCPVACQLGAHVTGRRRWHQACENVNRKANSRLLFHFATLSLDGWTSRLTLPSTRNNSPV